ncbi:MAG: DUF2188 domain-containing protein [Candidatus Saccharimonadales bacterium]
MAKKNVHITYSKDSKDWGVKSQGAHRAASRHQTKAEATQAGREIARNNKGELFIHNKDNKISDRDSYGNDPFPPRDRKH